VIGLSPKLNVEKGFFVAKYDSICDEISIKKLNDTHKDTWYVFHELIKKLSNDVLSTSLLTRHKQGMSAYLDSMRYTLEDRGRYIGGNWLSVYRNNVNYRHEYGHWYPYEKNSIPFDEIECFLGNKNPESFAGISLLEKIETRRYFALCSSILNLCTSLVADVNSVCLHRTSIHSLRPMAFLKHSHAG